jgi:dUTP pyrophosphatase
MAHLVPVDVQIALLRPSARAPEYRTAGASGADLAWDGHTINGADAIGQPCLLIPGGRALLSTGVALALPPWLEAQVRPRSGSSKRGLHVSLGTVDSDYRGEVMVQVTNFDRSAALIHPGECVAQIVLAPVVRARWVTSGALPPTDRGVAGFGSTDAPRSPAAPTRVPRGREQRRAYDFIRRNPGAGYVELVEWMYGPYSEAAYAKARNIALGLRRGGWIRGKPGKWETSCPTSSFADPA